MTEQSDNQDQQTPAYVASSVFGHFLDITSKRSWDIVTVSNLQDQGFSESQAYPLFSSLKVLKLIDDGGNPQANFEALWQATTDEDNQRALRKIVEDAYPELMKLDLTTHTIDTIDGFFRRRGVAPSVATRSARFFIWLAGLANVDIGAEVTVTKARKPSRKASSRKPKNEQDKPSEIDIPEGEYEEYLLSVILQKVSSSDKVPDVETIREIRDLAKSVQDKKRRYDDDPEPDVTNKQESEEDA